MELEKNIYGLSEGVFKACEFLDLKFPAALEGEHIPSDYFGNDFELGEATIKKLRSSLKWSSGKFKKEYKNFAQKFATQKPLKQTKTDLNIYFCDHALHSQKTGANFDGYFDFNFYKKSFAVQDNFLTEGHRNKTRVICNDACDIVLLSDKCQTNLLFSNFLHRDWLDTRKCTFEEFKAFAEKHSRFFSKLLAGNGGKGAKIISVDSKTNLEQLFVSLKKQNRLLEEIIVQHETLKDFCPDTLNTIRVYTVLDIHNVVHILVTCGRFGRVGKVVDNFHGGGFAAVIDSKTGIIASDAINGAHERVETHPDTGKVFKGFKYPYWDKICETVKKMAKMIPQLRHIGWDIAINAAGELVLVEVNGSFPDLGLQQAPDDTGRFHLYEPLLEELQNYKKAEMKLLGYRVNNLRNFNSAYNTKSRSDDRLKLAMSKLIPDCESLLDLGCRAKKAAKKFCPDGVQYLPVDYIKHDDEVIHWDFGNDKIFTPLPSQIAADACLCAFTAEFAEYLPQFLESMCNATRKQILMLCRPADLEEYPEYRWKNPFLTDFTEEFLIKTLAQNNFRLNAKEFAPNHRSVVIYDFRKV